MGHFTATYLSALVELWDNFIFVSWIFLFKQRIKGKTNVIVSFFLENRPFFNSICSIAIITFTWPSSTTWSPNLTTYLKKKISLLRPNVWFTSLLGLVVNSLPVRDEILSMCLCSGTCWMVVCQEGLCSSANINRQQKHSPLKKLIIHWFKGLTVENAR